MNTLLPWVLLAVVTLFWYMEERNDHTKPDSLSNITLQTTPWRAFSLEDLATLRDEQGEPYLPFLNMPTLRTGLYELPAGGTDDQQPHGQDEVYYVISGRSMFVAADDTMDVKPGMVLFVGAAIDRRFFDIQEDLQVLVFFPEAGAYQ